MVTTTNETAITSPARTTLLTFRAHSSDSVEIICCTWKGRETVTYTDRWLPEPEATDFRARLIHQGWTE